MLEHRGRHTMRAVAVFPASREVRVLEVAPPVITAPDEVLLRVVDVGVCGTDKEICAFEYGQPPAGEDHLVLGHECLAVVESVGSAVTRLAVGDLVVPSVRRPCADLACLPCRAGHQDYCTSMGFTERGIKGAHGYMADLVVERERFLTVAPSALRHVAVLTEPLTIAQKALTQVFALMAERPPWLDPETPPEQRGVGLHALVLGVGPVGILGAISLVTSGFSTFVCSRERPPSPKIELVESIGAIYRSSSETALSAVASEMGNVDLVYEAAGQSAFALEGLGALGANGIFVFTGIPGEQALVQSDPARIMRDLVLRNQVLLGTVNAGPAAFAGSLEMLQRLAERFPGAGDAMLAGPFGPEDVAELVHARQVGIKSVVSFSELGG
jgi:glucose 1-dehydrogenase